MCIRASLKALFIAEMGTSCTAICEQEVVNYTVTYTPVRKSIIDKDNLLRLKLEQPDIYEQLVTVSESRPGSYTHLDVYKRQAPS